MTKKALQMKELMSQLEKIDSKPQPSLQRRWIEDRHKPLPVEILVDAKQDRIHQEFRSPRKFEVRKIKRIRLKKSE